MSAGAVPLKRLFSSVRGGAWGTEPGTDDVTLPCVRGTDFDYAHLRVDLSSAPLRGFSRADVAMRAARRNDLIIEKSGGGETQPVGRVALHDHDDLVMPTNFAGRLRPARDVDSRFACYVFASLYAGGRTRAAIKQTTGIQNLDLDALLATRVRCPELPEQRAIADYLERETARIDALIERKQRLIQLLEERFQRLIDDVVWGEVDQPVPLMRRVQWNRPIMYGIVLPGPDVPHGVPIVKGGDVAAQRLSPDRLARTTPEIEAPYARARLHEADLVFAIRGGIGDVELVPPELEGANITQDVARVAPAADVDPKWLQLVLRSAEVRRQVEQRVTGATIKGLNIWDLKRVCVPPSDDHRQRADLARLAAEESRVCQLVDALGSQSSLLAEHRQALITAAVTGQLETPGVAA